MGIVFSVVLHSRNYSSVLSVALCGRFLMISFSIATLRILLRFCIFFYRKPMFSGKIFAKPSFSFTLGLYYLVCGRTSARDMTVLRKSKARSGKDKC